MQVTNKKPPNATANTTRPFGLLKSMVRYFNPMKKHKKKNPPPTAYWYMKLNQ